MCQPQTRPLASVLSSFAMNHEEMLQTMRCRKCFNPEIFEICSSVSLPFVDAHKWGLAMRGSLVASAECVEEMGTPGEYHVTPIRDLETKFTTGFACLQMSELKGTQGIRSCDWK